MRMYCSSAKYRDACESGKVIYASFYRTLLLLNEVQLKRLDISQYLCKQGVKQYALYGCNDVTDIYLKLCEVWKCLPDAIIESNVNKYRLLRSRVKLSDVEEVKDYDYIIVMSNYNFNQIAKELYNQGITFRQIISIEEFLAGIVCEGLEE